MATKSPLHTAALCLILSLEGGAAVSFPIPGEVLNGLANTVTTPEPQQLPPHWQTVQPPSENGVRPNSRQPGVTWNSFQPPEQGVPGRREGGGTRGCPTAITALIPRSTMGRTISAKPTFFYYIPIALNNKTVEFKLADERDRIFYKKSFQMVTNGAGIISVSLDADANSPALEVGKNYRWYFTVKCNPNSYGDDNSLVFGWINRVALAPTVKTELDRSSDRDRLSILTQQALWHEYLATLVKLRLSSPRDASLALKWSETLSSVGLDRFAREPLVESQLTPVKRR
jgi:Domain of Unknown Function (DUF928)